MSSTNDPKAEANGYSEINRRLFMQSSSAAVIAGAVSGMLVGEGLFASAEARAKADERPINKVREIENVWIPMPDGTRLAARIWLPEGAEQNPVPAIWNYCPYLKGRLTRLGDDTRYPYFAARGYACVRVDIRGSGDSEGDPQDEYVQQEQDDGVEVIKWIASQPWCTGSVGMEGLSWSGFSSLQVAACRPPALKAIMTHCSTDDRYADDAHYKGGAILHDMFGWGAIFWTIQGQPSDPAITGADGWRERWLDRLNKVEFNLGKWLEHQRRDAFWKHASVCEDYSQIVCPVYAIGGWVDGYKNTVFRLLEHLKVPTKGLVGPWTHGYPHETVPAPQIDYLNEALRWWDHWLKGVDTGIMDEPKLRVWLQDKAAQEHMQETPGCWAAEESWPSPRMQQTTLFLNADRSLGGTAGVEEKLVLLPHQTVGLASGNWCPSGGTSSDDLPIELAQDQRADDARSMTFDSAPLEEEFAILGRAEMNLDLSVDKPVAFLAVRLNEVSPTGESNRVTYAVQSLTHRDSDEKPEPIKPGKRYKVRIRFDNAAHLFSTGNRIRVSISTSYFPMVLPSPEPVTLTVYGGASSLTLPVRPPRHEDSDLRPFGKAYAPPVDAETLSFEPGKRIVEWDVANKVQTIHHTGAKGRVLVKAIDTELSSGDEITYRIRDDDPTSAVIEYTSKLGCARGGWAPRVESTARISMTKDDLILHGEMNAFDGEEKVFTKVWDRKIRRDLV